MQLLEKNASAPSAWADLKVFLLCFYSPFWGCYKATKRRRSSPALRCDVAVFREQVDEVWRVSNRLGNETWKHQGLTSGIWKIRPLINWDFYAKIIEPNMGLFRKPCLITAEFSNERTLCSHEASSIIYYIRCPEIYESDASFYCSFLRSGKRGPRGNGHPERNPGAHPWTTEMMELYTGKDEDQPLPNNPREDYCLFSSQ